MRRFTTRKGGSAARLPTPPRTKLAPPTSESSLLARPEVLTAFCGLRDKKLALVSGPSASGKSTLMAQGYLELAAQGMDVCWLSLDASDNDAQHFCTGLVSALQCSRPSAGAGAVELLRAEMRVPLQEVMTGLINDLTVSAAPLALFLDDFHELTNPDIHAAVSYLLQYSAASLHLAIASRAQPPLAIARLRARGAVVELGFSELRFTPREIRNYLHRTRKLDLSEAQIGMLAERTEGWIGGLQLATIALAQRTRGVAPPLALRAGGGPADASFADCLLEDIVARQSRAVRAFLAQTALLDQFCAPLADAVCGTRDSQVRIAELERANLFILRLDEERTWFRYHHLFSAFLRQRLQASDPALLTTLYSRASDWLAAHNQPAEALRYALRGGLDRLAVRLLETYGRSLLREGNLKELNYWLEALPRTSLARSAVLCALEAWTHLYLGDALAAIRSIRAAELALERGQGKRATAALRTLRAELQILSTMSGVTRYDLPNVAGLTPELPQAFGANDPLQRAYAHVVLGYAERLAGRLERARERYGEAVRISDASEDTMVNLIARYNVAVVDYLRARPDVAATELARWLGEARNRRWLRTGSAGFLRVALALMLLETSDTAAALTELGEAIDLLDATQTYAFVGVAQVVRAQALSLLGHDAAVDAELARARSVGAARNIDRVGFRADLAEAHHACRVGEPDRAEACLSRARAMLETSGHAAQPLNTEHHESWISARVRLELARGRFASGAKLASGGLAHARRAGRKRMQIEFLLWQALARQAVGEARAASRALGEALALASPAGVAYPFAAAGAALLPLLREQTGTHAAFARKLAQILAPVRAAVPAPTARSPRTQALHQREVQILKLLGLGLRNREIGERLFISEETVKWYLKRIYEALEVGNRTHALVRARDLGVLQ